MCEHEKSTLLHLVQSLAYHTMTDMPVAVDFSEKAYRDMAVLSYFIQARTGTTGSLNIVKGRLTQSIKLYAVSCYRCKIWAEKDNVSKSELAS